MLSSTRRLFTYPFCYTPDTLVREAAASLIERIDGSPELSALFSEGKMLGVLIVDDGERFSPLYGFSGNVSGRSVVEGFVPPILDLLEPGGHYRSGEAEISEINARIAGLSSDDPLKTRLKALRKEKSLRLQEWIFDHYVVRNALGEEASVREIFAGRGLVPPGGTGDCAAPKLLQYAYLNGLHPVAMGEFWYGASPAGEVRSQGLFYPSCIGKCGPLLEWMMRGLDVEANPLESDFHHTDPSVIWSDENIVVVDKPAGMLSVPGRGTGRISLLEWLSEHFGREVFSCHRLDMDTSGLMVYAFDLSSKVALEAQFAARQVDKSYIARLSPGSGRSVPASGTISLPLMLDYYDRPRQMVDFASGKEAVTDFELISMLADGGAMVRFHPRTGRTHQLRVHAAHHLGLGRPICGDRLYGNPGKGRLMLHAATISFAHPVTGAPMNFSSSTVF